MNLVGYLLFLGTGLSLYRLVVGPSLQDRLMSLTMFSSFVVLLLCLFAVVLQRSLYLDVAVIYALLSFSEILALLKFVGPDAKVLPGDS